MGEERERESEREREMERGRESAREIESERERERESENAGRAYLLGSGFGFRMPRVCSRVEDSEFMAFGSGKERGSATHTGVSRS